MRELRQGQVDCELLLAMNVRDLVLASLLRSLRVIVSVLAVVYVLTFLSGFLQATRYNFFNYIFFSLLFVGGIVLLRGTVRSKQTGRTKGFLFLTGISTTLLFAFYIGYEWSRLTGRHDLHVSLEALLYWLTLFFWIGAIGSLGLIRRRP